MKTPIPQKDDGNVLLCALCTILIVSLVGANVLINCTRHYNVTAKQLKAWKEAMYAAESGADAGLDEIRKLVNNSNPWSTDGWSTSAAPTPGPAWTKSFSGFGQNSNLSTTVTVDQLPDAASPNSLLNGNPYYRIRAVGTAKLLGLPRVGLSDKFFAGGPNFAANSSTRGVGDTLLRKIDFKYDHFQATYGDGDGNGKSLVAVSGGPQVTRRVEYVAVPKFYVFGGAMRLRTSFDGPGSSGIIDSYSSKNPNDPNPPGTGGQPIGANISSYWGPNPANATYLADAHDGDVSVATANLTEGGPIWGDVTTNGGNVTHSPPYQISGTIDNNVPFSIPPLKAPADYPGAYSVPSDPNNPLATSTDSLNPNEYVYSSTLNGNITIKNGNSGGNYPFAYVRIYVNGDITGKITLEKGVTAQIYFTGNMTLQHATDLNNQNVDRGTQSPQPYSPGVLGVGAHAADDPNSSAAGHLQFYGISPASGTQTIDIGSPGNIWATFYAPSADITLRGNPDIFSAVVARSFSGNGGGGGNIGFHYDKALNDVNIGVVTDYQVVSYVEDVR